jgi:hypothetical protein
MTCRPQGPSTPRGLSSCGRRPDCIALGGGAGGRTLPPAYWPPGSPGRPWCRQGRMPGGQARMSGSPPRRRSKRWGHSRLTACPAPRPPATVGGGVVDAPSARAASLASSAALPRPPGDAAHPAQLGGGDPYVNSYVIPYVIPYALGVRTPGFGGRECLSRSSPLRGSGAAAPGGALRAIDPCGAAAFLADLRSAPPSAAI